MKTDKLKELYEIADKEAIKILKDHLLYMFKHRGNKFDCIINAMGTTAFYKNHDPLWSHEAEQLTGYSELRSFLIEWNDLRSFLIEWNDFFHLTDYPIKIDKNGLKEHNEFK